MPAGYTRRQAIEAGATGVTAAALMMALSAGIARAGDKAPAWLTLLGRSEKGGRDYAPRVEGRIPAGLEGSLYRNGPGLFERGGVRKPHLLDGDGLVQRLSFRGGGVRYQNEFVRTRKLAEEAAAGRYLYATWSQRAPGGLFANLGGGEVLSQAGVTIYPSAPSGSAGARLYAFDEVSPPYAIDPERLQCLGEAPLGRKDVSFSIKAHAKRDPVSGDWLLAGITHGRTMQLHAIAHAADGTLKAHRVIDSPRQVYLHDFFATENHFVFLLHPLWFSPWLFLAGLDSYMDSLSWGREDGNLVLVVPRAGGEPRSFEAPGAFMWHALNAYEQGQEIVADFVGYDEPDHFIGENAMFYALMRGEMGVATAKGKLRRYVIDLSGGKMREEIVDHGMHEFPMVDPRVATRRHRVGFFASGGVTGINTGVKRVDYQTGAQEAFDFGALTAVGEPVFAARPGGAADQGWLIVQGLDAASGTAFFALFDATAVGAGPIAKLWLDHHLPISFHGAWVPA
jgi:all-trans-8'-apo-beta-carotenal 15,15'-oxygenase